MIYRIKFSDMKNLLIKFSTSEIIEPLLYFENEFGLYLFKSVGYSIFHSIVTIEELDFQKISLDSFKVEYLSHAIELLELPLVKPEVKLSISSN